MWRGGVCRSCEELKELPSAARIADANAPNCQRRHEWRSSASRSSACCSPSSASPPRHRQPSSQPGGSSARRNGRSAVAAAGAAGGGGEADGRGGRVTGNVAAAAGRSGGDGRCEAPETPTIAWPMSGVTPPRCGEPHGDVGSSAIVWGASQKDSTAQCDLRGARGGEERAEALQLWVFCYTYPGAGVSHGQLARLRDAGSSIE